MKRSAVIGLGCVLVAALGAWMWKLRGSTRADPAAAVEDTSQSTGDLVASERAPTLADSASGGSREPIEGMHPDTRPVSAPSVAAIRVYGSIKEADDRTHLIRKARVRFVRGSTSFATHSDNLGDYSIDTIAPGAWNVFADADGHRPWSGSFVINSLSTLQRFDIALEKDGLIFVSFRTPDGHPLDTVVNEVHGGRRELSITLLATGSAPDDSMLAARDAAGRVRGEIRDAGRTAHYSSQTLDRFFDPSSPPPFFLSACIDDAVVQTQHVELGSREVTFTLSLESKRSLEHRVSLRALDAPTGGALTGARAVLSTIGQQHFVRGSNRLDARGHAQIDRQLPGPAMLSIEAEGHERLTESVWIKRDQDTDLGTYLLARAQRVDVTFLDQEAQPLRIRLNQVRVDRFDGLRLAPCSLDAEPLDSTGSYIPVDLDRVTLGPLGPHVYLVRIRDAKVAARPTVLDLTAAPVHEITIRCVAQLRIAIRVEPATTDEVDVFDDAQLPVAELPVWPSAGNFVELYAPAGMYSAVSLREGRVIARRQFELAPHVDAVDLRE